MARRPKHPGVILQEIYLDNFGMGSAALAEALHVPGERVAAILHGQASMDADMALRLGRYFDKEGAYWLNLQQNYDLAKAEAEHDYSGIAKHPTITSFFP